MDHRRVLPLPRPPLHLPPHGPRSFIDPDDGSVHHLSLPTVLAPHLPVDADGALHGLPPDFGGSMVSRAVAGQVNALFPSARDGPSKRTRETLLSFGLPTVISRFVKHIMRALYSERRELYEQHLRRAVQQYRIDSELFVVTSGGSRARRTWTVHVPALRLPVTYHPASSSFAIDFDSEETAFAAGPAPLDFSEGGTTASTEGLQKFRSGEWTAARPGRCEIDSHRIGRAALAAPAARTIWRFSSLRPFQGSVGTRLGRPDVAVWHLNVLFRGGLSYQLEVHFDLRLGELAEELGGRFEVEMRREAGEGAEGRVYEARRRAPEERYAVLRHQR